MVENIVEKFFILSARSSNCVLWIFALFLSVAFFTVLPPLFFFSCVFRCVSSASIWRKLYAKCARVLCYIIFFSFFPPFYILSYCVITLRLIFKVNYGFVFFFFLLFNSSSIKNGWWNGASIVDYTREEKNWLLWNFPVQKDVNVHLRARQNCQKNWFTNFLEISSSDKGILWQLWPWRFWNNAHPLNWKQFQIFVHIEWWCHNLRVAHCFTVQTYTSRKSIYNFHEIDV